MLLAGMLAAPNLGPDYQAAFDAIFPDLAAKYGVTLYPFFLDGVAGEPAYQLEDGMHPNAAGVRAHGRARHAGDRTIDRSRHAAVVPAGVTIWTVKLTQRKVFDPCAFAKESACPSAGSMIR